jgi:predicted dehydrogenase
MQCLKAGKHVIVEKPLALTLAQADEMIAAAQARGLALVANLMQRYNPLFESIRALIERGTLGEVLHATFENYASDEQLGPDHWFWDRSKSGGIFVEHGVHFFDLFEGWLGPGEVVAAQRVLRPEAPAGVEIEEQVQCTVRHRNGAHVNLYHGFTQPRQLDRQELRLLFERGDVRLEEWVPIRLRLHALVDEEQTRELMELFPGARLDIATQFGTGDRVTRARHKRFETCQMVDVTDGLGVEKMHRYGELLRALMRDQLAWIRDPRHVRKVTHVNGRESLAMALAAARLAAR